MVVIKWIDWGVEPLGICWNDLKERKHVSIVVVDQKLYKEYSLIGVVRMMPAEYEKVEV